MPRPHHSGGRVQAKSSSRGLERRALVPSRLLENASQNFGVEWMSEPQHEVLEAGVEPLLDLFW